MVAVLDPRPRQAITAGHTLTARLPPGPLIQMALQQQPVLLARMDLQPGFQLTMPGARRLRPIQPVHHRVQMLPGRPRPLRPVTYRPTPFGPGISMYRADTAGAGRGR